MESGWWREPGSGAYARIEREWRWLLPAVPVGVSTLVAIDDRYLGGTTLRLRHMHGDVGDVYKLTQKVRPRDDDPSVTAVTNIYLTSAEHALLSKLPGAELRKVRRHWQVDGHALVVDELLGRWQGVVLAELEHDAETAQVELADAVDVTFDDRFTGAALASAGDDDVAGVHHVVRSLLAR
jgi:CYTH domain-containing protein